MFNRQDSIGIYINTDNIKNEELNKNKNFFYFKKCCVDVENKINDSGGIGGKSIKIYIDRQIAEISSGEKKDHFLKYLKKNKSIKVICDLPYLDFSSDENLKKNYVIFGDQRGTISKEPNVFDTDTWPNIGWRAMLRAALPKERLVVLINPSPLDKNIDLEHIDIGGQLFSRDKYIEESKEFFAEYNMDILVVPNLHTENSKLEEKLKKYTQNDYLLVTQRIYPIDKTPGSSGLENVDWSEVQNWHTNIYKTYLKSSSDANLVALDLTSSEKDICFNSEGSSLEKRIISLEGLESQPFLRMQDYLNDIGDDIDDNNISFLEDSLFDSLENIKLLKYIFSKSDYMFTDRKNFIDETIKRISYLDGKNDIFLGDAKTLCFSNNHNMERGVLIYENKRNSPENTKIEKNLFKKQIFCNNDEQNISHVSLVSYVHIDMLRIQDISIENGTFQAKFFFELTTPHSDGINIIEFGNSTLDSESAIVKVSEEKIKDDYIHFRYIIEDTFSFESIPDNYPFDMQLLYISYGVLNEEKYGIIQPVTNLNVDMKFQIDGWKIHSTRAGLFRTKQKLRPVIIQESVAEGLSSRIGWIISRSSSMTLLKVLVPLSFLWLLVLYGLFLPVENLDRAVGVITTSFLSGIALYFSTERPQPLRMTVIDFVFAFFYLTVGIASVAVFSLNFFPEIYNEFMSFVKYLLPFSIFIGYGFLYRRVNSKKFFPRMISK